MRIKNKQDFWAGLMFVAIGLGFAGSAQQYELGTAGRMGPGYFPTALGALLLLLGVFVCWSSAARSAEENAVADIGWRELLLIVGSVAAFGIALPWLGLVGAVTLLVLISASASHELSFKETGVLVLALLALSYSLFVKGLELQFPVWPAFLRD